MTWRNRVLELRQVRAAELKQNPRNFRRHPERQSKALRGVLEEVGIAGALLAYNHPERGLELIDGHLRQEQGGVWPVLVLDVTENEANILLATHDPIGMMAEQDAQTLRDLVAGLEVKNAELAAMLEELSPEPPAALGDPEAIPDAPSKAVSQTGDLWLLGNHRVLCGDSTRADDVERLLGGDRATACVTDPPFAIMGSSTGVKNDPSLIRPFFRIFWNAIRQSGAQDVYMFCDWRSFPTIHNEADGWDVKDVIVWDKMSGGMGNPYRRRHEFIVFARPATSDKKILARTTGVRSITDDDVWQCKRQTNKEHFAQKPIEIVARCITNSSDSEDVIFEPCGGSGTTLIAAEQTDRKCYAMEISPEYADVIVKRWQTFTGRQATLEATGQTFAEVEADRG